MIYLSFQVDNKKYQVEAERGEDLLNSLDNFLKKRRINIVQLNHLKLDLSREKSVTSQRIAQVIVQAIKIGQEW